MKDHDAPCDRAVTSAQHRRGDVTWCSLLRSDRRWTLIFCRSLACTVLTVAFSWTLAAQSRAEGRGSWCAGQCGGDPPVCTSSAAGACYSQYLSCGNSHNDHFGGARPTSNWAAAKCSWATRPGGVYPGAVTFVCESGYIKAPPGRCVKADELDENERPPCRSRAGSLASPATPNPISLLTGSKLLHAVDFETADGLLSVSRSYRSTPFGRAEIVLYEPAGLGSGWRFDFLPELHVRPYFNAVKSVTLHWPDGSSWDFRRDLSGTMSAVSSSTTMLPHGEFRLAFEGAWPSDLSLVETAVTRWKVIDPDGNVWVFATTNFLDETPVRYRLGLPLSKTTPAGYRQDYTYGKEGELIGITDSFGRSISFEWILRDSNLPPELVNQPITPMAIRAVTLPDRTLLRYTFEALEETEAIVSAPDHLVRVEHLAADATTVLESTTYHHENADYPNYVTGITDSRGVRIWNFAYDARGRAVWSAGSDGVDAYAVAYSPSGVSPPWRDVTNPFGRTSRYRYNGTSFTRLVGIDGAATTNCAADTASIGYFSSGASAGYISSTTDQEGRVTTYVRDGRGRPTTITEATGTAQQRVTTIRWHAVFDVPLAVVRPGLTTTYTYNATGARTSLTQTDTTTHTVPYRTAGQRRKWTFTHTPQGLLDKVDGPLAGPVDVVDYDYDTVGNLTRVKNALGHVTEIASVNGRGQPTRIIDANGVATLVEYDALGRVTAVTRAPGPGQATTRLDYDSVGDITRITRPDGSFLAYAYDGARRVATISSNEGETIAYEYDNTDQPVSVEVHSSTGAVIASRTLAYDEIGRVLRLVGAGMGTTGFSYDKVGNLSSVTDQRGGFYGNAFDRLDRLVSQTDPESGVTAISFDPRDNVTTVTDAGASSTTFVVNGFGDVIRRISPDTGVTDYTVDVRGLVTSVIDARGVTTKFSYDALGRVRTKSFPAAAAENVTYEYDDATSGNRGVGRSTGFTDASGRTAYRYDALGRIVKIRKTIAGDVFVIGYQYDAVGRVVALTYPSGRVVTFTRNGAGRVSDISMRSSASAASQTVASSVTYLPFYPAELFVDAAPPPGLDTPLLGGLTGFTHGNGLVLSLNYDVDGRLTAMRTADATKQIQDLTLIYDSGADVTAIVDNLDSDMSQSFGYDAVGRLVNASGPYGDIDYAYDLVGNRIHRTIDDGAVTDEAYAYAAGTNRLSSVTAGSTLRTFGYTAAGSTSSDARAGATLDFSYNLAGRLASVAADSGPLASREYTYDALQHRVRELRADRVGAVAGIKAWTIAYVYDAAGHLLAEYATLGLMPMILHEYLWLDDTPVAMIDHTKTGGDKLLAIHTDHLGRPQTLTDAGGKVVWDGRFDPFGEQHAIAGTTEMPLRFPGQEYDTVTGLSHNRHRDYDPTLGRYLQSDPIGLEGGINTYAYALGNPTRYSDRLGLYAELCTRYFYPVPVPYARHCFLRFNGDNADTIGFDSNGTHGDPAPVWWPRSCSATQGDQDDECVKKQMQKCMADQYDFTGFNCCHCAERAMKACGLSVPPGKWPNWPVNPRPLSGRAGLPL